MDSVKRMLVGWLTVMLLIVLVGHAEALEYRLQVVSLYSTAFSAFLKPGELGDGASGPGLNRLEATLDSGELSKGVILFDRRVQPVSELLGRAYGGSRITPLFNPGPVGAVSWDELVWDGTPGERSVWLVSPTVRNVQELRDTALRGRGALRHFQAYAFPMNGARLPVLSLPLNFLWFHEERGTAWDKYLSRGLDLGDGIGVVVGVNTNTLFPDQVYVIVSHAEQPTTYKAVLVWRERNAERQGTGTENPLRQR